MAGEGGLDGGISGSVNGNVNTGNGVDPAAYGLHAASSERYRLTVAPSGIRIAAASPQGLFRAAATLIQLVIAHPGELPCADIRDEPDFPVRGFYRDVTRGRVPTLRSLKSLADTLAFYKVNHLQLYVEHAFAFSKIPELHEGKTPLTPSDIAELDAHCARRGVELVPSLSTFGHLYELLRLPRFEHLNELDVRASQTPRCLWDRMAHYTLDVRNPGSFEAVRGMIEEYAPLFSSPWFNVCCDETFDLGKGKNAALAESAGVGRLYVDFVNKVIGVVRSAGKKPMLWGDIVLKHPELIGELPPGTVFLNWDYLPDASGESVKKFRGAGAAQYVCPGVQGWSRFAADVDRACSNISRMTRFGMEAGALGALNTDWGDCGQVNLPATSYHGLAFGAERSWNAGGGNCGDDFDRRFSVLQWGIDGPRLGKLLRELGGLSEYHFGNLYAWVTGKRCLWYKEDDVLGMDVAALAGKAARAAEIKNELSELADDIINAAESSASINGAGKEGARAEFEEYVWSASATEWLLSLLIAKKKYEYGQEAAEPEAAAAITPKRLVDGGNILLEQFKALWRARNRESELRDVVETFERIFERVSEFQR
jgi:hypothetical protein